MKLSILIPSLYKRYHLLNMVLEGINSQNAECLEQTEVLINTDCGKKPTGTKRNELLRSASGEYVVFIDDDDLISWEYLQLIFEGIKKDVDHIGISMIYQEDGGPEKMVRCSKQYGGWGEENGVYLRTAQHVCPIKREIALQVKYPDISFGEDKAYSDQINKLIQTEHLIATPIYYYKFRTIKTV